MKVSLRRFPYHCDFSVALLSAENQGKDFRIDFSSEPFPKREGYFGEELCFLDELERMVHAAKAGGIVVVHEAYSGSGGIKRFVAGKLSRLTFHEVKRELRVQTGREMWLATLPEIKRFLRLRMGITWRILGENEIEFINSGDREIRGLTARIDETDYVIDKIPAKGKFLWKREDYPLEVEKVSIVLTVYNGEQLIIDSLRSLTEQTYRNKEIIVVNDGSTDGTRSLLEEYISRYPAKAILINQENGGRAHAKNVGFAASDGDVVVFCEDDAFYSKRYIENAMRRFSEEGKNCAGVIGPHFVWNKDATFTTRIKDIERRRNFIEYDPESCWFYRAKYLKEIGGFNENIEFGEDVEPARRLRGKNFHFAYEESCLWLHTEPPRFGTYLWRKFKGGVGMNLLERLKIKSKIVPDRFFWLLALFVFALLGMIVWNWKVAFICISFVILLLPFLRFHDILRMKQKSDENTVFRYLGILVEYAWWAATFSGYVYGKFLSREDINRYLRGR